MDQATKKPKKPVISPVFATNYVRCTETVNTFVKLRTCCYKPVSSHWVFIKNRRDGFSGLIGRLAVFLREYGKQDFLE